MARGLGISLGLFLGMTLAAPLEAAQEDCIFILFNGQDLAGWQTKEGTAAETLSIGKAKLNPDNPTEMVVEPGGNELINAKGGAKDFFSDAKFGDALIEVEFMVPKDSNSGVYVMGEYEVQVLDSFGKTEVTPADVGGIYGAQAPRVNAAKAPGQWQKFVIDFRAPKFDSAGNKTANARFVKVTLNDQVIQENIEMTGPTPGGISGKEAPEGPLMFQGNHGPVAYRNVRVTPIK